MTQTDVSDDLAHEKAYPNFIQVTSKQTGKLEFFLCPYCRMFFDAFVSPKSALVSCIKHAKQCANRSGAPADVDPVVDKGLGR